jgi:hypothetical protein
LIPTAKHVLDLGSLGDEIRNQTPSSVILRPGTRTSTRPAPWLRISAVLLELSFSFFSGDRAAAQILTHGLVVGGVTDTQANVFVRTDQAATVSLQYYPRILPRKTSVLTRN